MNVIYSISSDFLQTKGVGLAWIICLYFFARIFLSLTAKKIVKILQDAKSSKMQEKRKRAETLSRIIYDDGNIVIAAVFVIMLLDLFGLDIGPIIAGLGIVGLAFGFGAQSLVRDFVSGLFILTENQFGIGDEVQIGSFVGTVKRITLRSTVLENEKGAQCYIANGSITNVINFSQKGN